MPYNTKYNYAGHVARMNYKKWTKIITKWKPKIGKRRVGRQKQRWEDELRQMDGVNWLKNARDRKYWKERVKETLLKEALITRLSRYKNNQHTND